MKRLLLTLLGAAALCGLSPHAAAEEPSTANVLHMDFNKRTADHNQDLHFYGKLQTLTGSTTATSLSKASKCEFYTPTEKRSWPTSAVGLLPTENQTATPYTYTYKLTGSSSEGYPRYDTSENYDGIKTIENDQLKLELNYWYSVTTGAIKSR